MAIELISKIKPKNNGTFAMVDASDVEMPDGSRLSDMIFKTITEEEYEALKNAGELNETTLYMIVESDSV
jgi:hypothetical protein